MRFTKKLCALISSLAVVSAQVVTQTPPPATAPANPDSDDAKLREALRKALDSGAGTPVAPAPPPTTVIPAPTTNVSVILAPPPYSVTVTNIGGINVTS